MFEQDDAALQQQQLAPVGMVVHLRGQLERLVHLLQRAPSFAMNSASAA